MTELADSRIHHLSNPFFITDGAAGIRLRIRLTPGSRQEGFGGTFTDGEGNQWLRANVRAVPEDGKANAALIALLAKTLGIARSGIVHVSGHASRMKVFELPNSPQVGETLRQLAAL